MKAVIIYSGGMDSFTLLHTLIAEYGNEDISALSFNYAQKHAKELIYASETCEKLNVKHTILDMGQLKDLLSSSALTSDIPVPEGHYENENMKLTVVPNRNMIMLSVAVGHAISIGAMDVYFGAHAGDHAIYPDCREHFILDLNVAVSTGNYTSPVIHAPFIDFSKARILAHGIDVCDIGVMDYKDTWTCYKGGVLACGKCGACRERLEAFESIGEKDPLHYEE